MKAFKRIIALILTLTLLLSAAACAGAPGEKGDKGDAVTLTSLERTETSGLIDTYTMTFSDGSKYTFAIKNGTDGINGTNGSSPSIGTNGNWWIGDKDTGVKAEGEKGETVTVSEIKLISSSGLIDTYTMLLSDGNNFNFQVKNGADGKKGETVSVNSVEKTGTEGLVDTYTITYSNGQTFNFTVTNGKDGAGVDKVTMGTIEKDSSTSTTVTYKINYSDDSSSTFTVITDGEGKSDAVTEYEAALNKGYEMDLDTWIISLAEQAKDALLTSGSVLGAKTLGAAMGKILSDYYTYYITNVSPILIRKTEIGETVTGKYISSGNVGINDAYQYNKNPIPVSEGEIFKIINKNTNEIYKFRFWDAYNGTNIVTTGVYPSMNCDEVLVPAGVDGIIATWYVNKTDAIAAIYKNNITTTVSDQLDTYNVNTLVNGTMGGGGGGVMRDTEANIIISAVLGSPSILAKADALPSKQWMYISNEINTIMNNKTLSFSCDIEGTLGANEEILVGHGYTDYASSYIVLTGTHLKVYEAYSADRKYERINVEHGLTIKDFINITIDANIGMAKITIGSSTGMFQKETSKNHWEGRNGKIYAVSLNRDVENAKLRWSCEGYNEKIWLYGDSYFNTGDPSRWPSYLVNDGHTNNMMSGYPGMATQTALSQFKEDIKRGTPQYVVWCMGMNNGDTNKTTVNSTWLSCTEEFLAICNEKGITPILTTIPSTPTVFNYAKSEWVRNSGYRYIDFSRAVGGDMYDSSIIGKEYTKPDGTTANNVTGNEWYANMLHGDLVHPAQLGAQALYTQVLVDFPEITKKD